MNTFDGRGVDPLNEMSRVAQSFLNLKLWGFKESYRSRTSGDLIYDSEWCRINFVWGGWDPMVGNSISIYYGRLHALNEKTTMIWNGEECRCWHDFEYTLHFLDGRIPADVARLHLLHPIRAPFFEEKFRQKFRRRQPEWLAEMHAAIWEHYDKRLFELFDLRHPDIWERYRQFLKGVYDIKGRSPSFTPPLDKVC